MRRSGPPDALGSQAGSAEAGFLAAARGFAGLIRGGCLVLIGAFGVLAVPGEHLVLGLVLLGLTVVVAVVQYHWRPGFVLVLALVLVLCLTQRQTGAPPNQWTLNALTITMITAQWDRSPRVVWLAVAGSLAVQLVVAGPDSTVGTGLRLVVECSLAQLGFTLLRHSSGRVDRLRARRAELARAEALSRERRRQEREYLALLHDTACATLLLVAGGSGERTGADPARVAEYARHDLTVLTGPDARDSPADLGASLRSVAARGPLPVRTDLADGLRVPAPVALAVVRAVREALVNVERHAGVRTATVTARGGERVVVTVRDEGAGFRPEAVPAGRQGLRMSIVDRIAGVGGGARVVSRPGEGTTVRLVWPDA